MVVGRSSGALRILLQFLRAQEAGAPYAFRFAPQDYILPTAGGSSPSARFDWTPALLADLQAARLPGRDPAVVQRIGDTLRSFVKNAGWEQHEREIAQAHAEHRPIFVTIRSSAAELYALPWEFLTLPSGQFIGEVDGLLLRFEWPTSPSAKPQPTLRPEGGRILVAWSESGGAVPAAEHIHAIAAAAAAGFHPFNPATDVIAHASLSRLAETLEAAEKMGPPIAVLHLLCHGGAAGSTFGLCLDGADGRVVVDATQLRQQLAPFASMVRLVVLSACDSGNSGALGNQLGSIAQTLHRCGYQAVLASRFPLSVAGSISLTESLYGEMLCGPASLETAFLAARKRLLREDASSPQRRLDWASVQLYARHEDGDDTRPVVFRPFRGLLAFQPEHRRFFFGRDNEIKEVLHNLQALIDHSRERFLIVAGASGTGKSSLVLAGVVPRILAQNPQLELLRMRPGSDPERALSEVLTACPAGRQSLLVVDQLEEIFTQTAAPAARDGFVRRLWSLASAPEPGVRVLITLRVDFIGRCGELVVNATGLRLDRVAYDEEYRVFVAQLEPTQLRAAIVEPARKVGLELQAGLADRMLDEVDREPGALPLLADALDTLWQHRDEHLLTQAAYEALGGVVGALQKRADAIIAKLTSAEDLAVVRRLLVELVTVADDTTLDTRRRVPLAELRPAAAAAQIQSFERVLKELVEARLLVQNDDGHAAMVEVAHEALIRKWPRLRVWLNEDRAGLLVQRRVKQAAQHWAQQGRDESLLYRGAQLIQASEWRKAWESRLGHEERSFLDASEALEEARIRRARQQVRQTRAIAAVLGMLLVVAVAAGSLAYLNAKAAKQNAVTAQQKSDEAHDGMLVAVAQTLKEDPTTAAAILREAGHRESTLWVQAVSDVLQRRIAETVLRGDDSAVKAVIFSGDGQKIITGSAGPITVRSWNADGSRSRDLFARPDSAIRSVVFSPEGKKLATFPYKQTAVQVWNADGAGEPIVLSGFAGDIEGVAFSRDGSKLATGSREGAACIWNADGSGSPIVLKVDDDYVTAVAFSPDGRKLATGSRDKIARIWNADGSGPPIVLKGHTDGVTAVAFSADGTQLATGSGLGDKTVRIWHADGSGSPIVLVGHESGIFSVTFSPDGKQLITSAGDGTARIWPADGSAAATVLRGHSDDVVAVAISADGKKLVTGSADHTARVWNSGFGADVMLTGPASGALSLAFSPDGEKLITGFADGSTRIQRTDGAGTPVVLTGHASPASVVAFSSDGTKLVIGFGDGAVQLWNSDGSGAPLVLTGHTSRIIAAAFSPDGNKLVTSSHEESTARLWNIGGAHPAVVLSGHLGPIPAVAFSPDGAKILTGSGDGTARLWNADGSGTPVVLRGHEDVILSVAFSADGKKIVTGSQDKTARIWNADGSGAPVVLAGHQDTVALVAFLPAGNQIITHAWDATTRIWNSKGKDAVVVLKDPWPGSYALALSRDGKKLAAGFASGAAYIWRVTPESLLSALWDATSDCVPAGRRHELLQESPADATLGYERCRQEVARRHGWPAQPVH